MRSLPTAAEVERALAQVYARPELAPAPASPLRRWLESAWAAVRDFLGALFPTFELTPAAARGVVVLAVILAALLAALVLAHFAGVFRESWRGRGRRPGEQGAKRASARSSTGNREQPGASAGAEEWEAAARRAAAAGRWREAALALYQALLLRLDARGALRFDAAKTPGDYRRETRSQGEAARVLDGFLRLFEPVAFGARPLDGRGYEALRAAAMAGGVRG